VNIESNRKKTEITSNARRLTCKAKKLPIIVLRSMCEERRLTPR
jgi:hypothetical protein